MSNYRPQFLIPNNEEDFEDLCADVYGTIFNCPNPSKYGRRGQAQHGLDLVLYRDGINSDDNRIGVQCKHVQKLTFDGKHGDSFIKELQKAEKGQQKISKFILVTSLPSDARLLDKVNKLSQARLDERKFPVEIHFANDLETKINSSKSLSERYLLGKNYEILLKEAEKFINKEQYSVAINMLDASNIELMNQQEKFQALTLLAISYLSIDSFDKFIDSLQKLEDFDWDDDNLTNLRIVKLSIQQGREVAEAELNRLLELYPKNLNLIALKTLYDIQKGIEINFDDLDAILKSNYDIQFSFMESYINFGRHEFEKFHTIYENLASEDKSRPSALIYKLNAELLEYYKRPDNKDKIRQALDNFRKNTDLERIEKPAFKGLALNAILNAYAMLNNFENSKYWYEYAVDNNIELNEYAKHNLVILSIKNNNNLFFIDLLDKFSNQELKGYFLDGLFHFNAIEKIQSILQENQNLAPEIQNELKSYLILKNKLNQVTNLEEYISEHRLFEVNSTKGLTLLGFSFFNENKEQLFDASNEKILEINYVADLMENMYLGSYFFTTEQFEKSIEHYQKVLDSNSVLHEYDLLNYLDSLLATNRFMQAKKVIEENWDTIQEKKLRFFELIRHLGYEIQDLPLIEKYLANLTQYNDSAWYWRNKLQILITSKQDKALKRQLKAMPLNLKNEKYNTCWLILQEVIFGQKDKALERLLNFWHEKPDDLEVLQDMQALFLEMMVNPQVTSKLSQARHPFFDYQFNNTTDGCFIKVKVNNEQRGYFLDSKVSSNDPNKFINPLDSWGSQFLDKKIGDVFRVTTPFGSFDYELLEIKSIPLAVFHNNSALASQPNNLFNMLSLEVNTDTEEGIKEFIKTINRLSTPNDVIKNQFERYISSPMTIALLGKLLHKDIAELTYSWIQDFRYPLYTNDDRYTKDLSKLEAQNRLQSKTHFTIDLFTLLEFKRIGVSDFLENIDNLVVSSSLIKQLQLLIDKHNFDFEINQKSETVSTFDNKFQFHTVDTNILKIRSDDLKFVMDFLETNAEIYPAYGNDFQSNIHKILQQHLPEIDKSTLRLAQEYNLTLISLDARLRALASQVGIDTINGNYFIESQLQNEDEYKKICLNQFSDNRLTTDFHIKYIIDSSTKNSPSLNKYINAYLSFLTANFDLEHILHEIITLIYTQRSLGFGATYGYVTRLCEIAFCLLAKHEKLDFERDKNIANDYYWNSFRCKAIQADSFEELKSLQNNTLGISYGFLNPRLIAKTTPILG